MEKNKSFFIEYCPIVDVIPYNNKQFEKIENDTIIYKKLDTKTNTNIATSNITPDTLNIGKLVYEMDILSYFDEDSKKVVKQGLKLLSEINPILNTPDLFPISKEQLKEIYEKQIIALDRFLKEKLEQGDIPSKNFKLSDEKLRKNLYILIEDWVNLYGGFISNSNRVKQYIDLYDFLSECQKYYNLYNQLDKQELSTYTLDVNFKKEIILENTKYISKRMYYSIFDYIEEQIVFSSLEASSGFKLKECCICGNIFKYSRNTKDDRTCCSACRKRKNRIEKQSKNNIIKDNNTSISDNTIKAR